MRHALGNRRAEHVVVRGGPTRALLGNLFGCRTWGQRNQGGIAGTDGELEEVMKGHKAEGGETGARRG